MIGTNSSGIIISADREDEHMLQLETPLGSQPLETKETEINNIKMLRLLAISSKQVESVEKSTAGNLSEPCRLMRRETERDIW